MLVSRESVASRRFWANRMAVAGGLLSLGSCILLLGGLAFAADPWGNSTLFVGYGIALGCPLVLGNFFAIILHLGGWSALWDGIQGVGDDISRRFMSRVFRFSVFAFATGMAGALVLALLGWGAAPVLLLGGAFPYVPFVWAPVVMSHSVLFVHASRLLRAGRLLMWLGSGLLFGVAVVGLGMLAFPGFGHGLPWLMAGLTGPGYALVSFGCMRISSAGLRPATLALKPPVAILMAA